MHSKLPGILLMSLAFLSVMASCGRKEEYPQCDVREVCEVCEACPEGTPVNEADNATDNTKGSSLTADDIELFQSGNTLYMVNLIEGYEVLLLESGNFETIGIINNRIYVVDWENLTLVSYNHKNDETDSYGICDCKSVELEGKYIAFYGEDYFDVFDTEKLEYINVPSDVHKKGAFYYKEDSWWDLPYRIYSVEAINYEGQSLGVIETRGEIEDCVLSSNYMAVMSSNSLYLTNFSKPDSQIEISFYDIKHPELSFSNDHTLVVTYSDDSWEITSETIILTESNVFHIKDGGYETFYW